MVRHDSQIESVGRVGVHLHHQPLQDLGVAREELHEPGAVGTRGAPDLRHSYVYLPLTAVAATASS